MRLYKITIPATNKCDFDLTVLHSIKEDKLTNKEEIINTIVKGTIEHLCPQKGLAELRSGTYDSHPTIRSTIGLKYDPSTGILEKTLITPPQTSVMNSEPPDFKSTQINIRELVEQQIDQQDKELEECKTRYEIIEDIINYINPRVKPKIKQISKAGKHGHSAIVYNTLYRYISKLESWETYKFDKGFEIIVRLEDSTDIISFKFYNGAKEEEQTVIPKIFKKENWNPPESPTEASSEDLTWKTTLGIAAAGIALKQALRKPQEEKEKYYAQTT